MVLSEFLRKTFVYQKSRAQQAGQAVVEYILVLVITVGIITGLMYQFNSNFREFIDAYFGDYIACLLETGELPALRGADSGICQKPEMNINVSADVQSGGGGNNSRSSGDGSRSGGGSSGDDDTSSSSSGSNRPLRPSRISSAPGAGNGEAAGSAAQSRRSGRPLSHRLKNAGERTGRGDLDSRSDGFDGSSGRRGGRSIVRKRVIYVDESFYDSAAEKKKMKKEVIGKAGPKEKKKGVGGLQKERMKLDLPEKRKTASEIEETRFGFGAFIKFLLIAGILIAIFIFLGGQALQIKKSWQKSE